MCLVFLGTFSKRITKAGVTLDIQHANFFTVVAHNQVIMGCLAVEWSGAVNTEPSFNNKHYADKS